MSCEQLSRGEAWVHAQLRQCWTTLKVLPRHNRARLGQVLHMGCGSSVLSLLSGICVSGTSVPVWGLWRKTPVGAGAVVNVTVLSSQQCASVE